GRRRPTGSRMCIDGSIRFLRRTGRGIRGGCGAGESMSTLSSPARRSRAGAAGKKTTARRRTGWRDNAAWRSPVTTYYLIGGVSLLLLVLGLIMVLSSSSIYSLASSGGANAFTDFLSQASYALIAVPIAFGLSRLPVRAYRALAWAIMVVTL